MSNQSDDKNNKTSKKGDAPIDETVEKTEGAKPVDDKGDATKSQSEQSGKSAGGTQKSDSSKDNSKTDAVATKQVEHSDTPKPRNKKPESVKAEVKPIDSEKHVRNDAGKSHHKEPNSEPTASGTIDESIKAGAKDAQSSQPPTVDKGEATNKSKKAQTSDGPAVSKNATATDTTTKKDAERKVPVVRKSENNLEKSADEVQKHEPDKTEKKLIDHKDVVRDASVTTTISPGNKIENVSIDPAHGSRTIAENIFPEKMHVKNLSGLFEPTLPPLPNNQQQTYAAIEAAAANLDYGSRQDVISSVQSILKPKGEFLSRAELLHASKQLQKVMPYNFDAWRLHADILLNALRQLETRAILPDESFQILAIPLRENDIRDAAEAALRQCAHFAVSEERRIRLIDEANSVRRVTWF